MEVDARDITKEPPPREFLERHVEADRLADFLSTRSPVFKTRPLPRTKAEAVGLMLEQPNLIRRPVLVAGGRVVFGFDKDAYRRVLGYSSGGAR